LSAFFTDNFPGSIAFSVVDKSKIVVKLAIK